MRKRLGGLAVLTLAVAGCGGGAPQEARDISDRTVIEQARTLQEVLIEESEIRNGSSGTPERSLLRFWSNLQYQAWKEAVGFYEDDLRAFIGDDRLQIALANQAAHFRTSRPEDLTFVRGQEGTISRFMVTAPDGNKTPASITWVRAGDRWEIVHDGFLDHALSQARQLDVQIEVDPLAKMPGKEAVRAGHHERKLQARYAASRQRSGAGGAGGAGD